ncbi:MAG TPA: tol-pal system protein YbgF [Nevskiales bacterium]|nr:tol-pal system protein YbgF [Nevskiales bacterium]
MTALRPPRLCAALFALGLLCGGPALAQQAPPPTAANPLLFELLNRLDRLEQEVRQLRGDLEVTRYRGEEQAQRLEMLEQQWQQLQSSSGQGVAAAAGGAATPSAPLPPPATGQEATLGESAPLTLPPQPGVTVPAPRAAEQEAYDAAFGKLRDGQYQQAAIAFEDFIRAYPSGELTANAYYWLGEAYYVNQDYANARQTFLKLGAKYPKSDKLPDAMLKLGYSYERLGDKKLAREVLQKLRQNYPDSRAAKQAEERLRQLQ